jgi:hypothetical protein
MAFLLPRSDTAVSRLTRNLFADWESAEAEAALLNASALKTTSRGVDRISGWLVRERQGRVVDLVVVPNKEDLSMFTKSETPVEGGTPTLSLVSTASAFRQPTTSRSG